MGPPAIGAGHTPPHGFFKTLGMVTLLRLPPNSPFALMNLLMSSVKVPRVPFVLGTIIGMSPRTVLAVVIGAGVNELTNDELTKAVPDWVIYGGIGLTVVVMVVIGIVANRAIERLTGKG